MSSVLGDPADHYATHLRRGQRRYLRSRRPAHRARVVAAHPAHTTHSIPARHHQAIGYKNSIRPTSLGSGRDHHHHILRQAHTQPRDRRRTYRHNQPLAAFLRR